MGVFHFRKIAIFWKFENFGRDLRKKFWRPKFPFIICSVDFYHFFLNRNSLKVFYYLILKILKKLIFLKKHAGFARTLKFFFDFNVAHLKMTYRFSGVTNTTYIVIKHFSNTEKNIFLKFWNKLHTCGTLFYVSSFWQNGGFAEISTL